MMEISDLITEQKTISKHENDNPNLKEKRIKIKNKSEECFKQRWWSYACSGTFNSNMYGIDNLP